MSNDSEIFEIREGKIMSSAYSGKFVSVEVPDGTNPKDITIPENAEAVIIKGKNLPCLPDIPEKVALLWCDNCGLNDLGQLPQGLSHLWCANNNLTELPDLPNECVMIGNGNPWSDTARVAAKLKGWIVEWNGIDLNDMLNSPNPNYLLIKTIGKAIL